ncbi:preprotein translocase subunit SecA, partial [Gammaproteobacteria bacterium]|nr:preprotein translocase subunit SecA [Gammaproteobacteria bacterium]
DDVANDQRQAIYSLRNQLLNEDNISEAINDLINDEMRAVSNDFVPLDSVESQWRLEELDKYLFDHYLIEENIAAKVSNDQKLTPDLIATLIADSAAKKYKQKYLKIEDNLAQLEKQVMLQILDVHWKDHLSEMDHLRQSVGLRAYAQKNPKNEYKREAFEMFEVMLGEINAEAIKVLFRIELASEEEIQELEERSREAQQNREMKLQQEQLQPVIGSDPSPEPEQLAKVETVKTDEPKLQRNEIVKITNGKETKELKYKKAQPLIEAGEWKII